MARKKRQRISYVLPLANSPGGHRLGVNGLALDRERDILYSGGRDGVICAWDLNFHVKHKAIDNPFASPEDSSSASKAKPPRSTFRDQVQAHTHWVNDVILTQGDSALVSASSDVTVKVWRPHSEEAHTAQTVGVHSDYVKSLTTPTSHADWVASGGLDHKIILWDLNGAGEKLQIDVGGRDDVAKGSIYALCAKGSILASGGPESIARIWDPKTGKNITKLVGHTDNIRDILISEDGETVMTASSDQTVKLWSMAAGRCMHTLTMHNDSVWSLYSDHPRLSLFYSSDRSGLVAKTDTRNTEEVDEGVSVAALQEHDGVNKIIAEGDYIWTATSSSSINRWLDVDTEAEIEEPPIHPEPGEQMPASKPPPESESPQVNGTAKDSAIPFNSTLRLSVTSPLRSNRSRELDNTGSLSLPGIRKPSEVVLDSDPGIVLPIRDLAEETIEGQNGLIKHSMLNDRKRVLTLDTTGEVVLWDLLKCVPIRSFGKKHLDDVLQEVNTFESVANWCAVDTRTGKLSVMLEENYCFDAEMYADEVDIEESIEFREDQRINLGKWVLRNLFTNLIDEEIRRDETYRQSLVANSNRNATLQRGNAPISIEIPRVGTDTSGIDDEGSAVTPKPAANGLTLRTPGLSIGVATPGGSHSHQPANTHLPATAEEGSNLQKTKSQTSQGNNTAEKSHDYFSANPNTSETSSEGAKAPSTPSEAPLSATPTSPTDPEKAEEKKKGLFGKKFQMNFPKKLGRSSVEVKPQVTEEKADDSDKSSEKEEKVFDDNFNGVIQRMRHDYEEHLASHTTQPLTSGITPSLPNETPVLKPPPQTLILIQEDNPESGGVQDLYWGTAATLGKDADFIEKLAPAWLGDLLLRNALPPKDPVKVSFILQPLPDGPSTLPPITPNPPSAATGPGTSDPARLNANRMLRAKKIMAYVAERIEPAPEKPDPDALKPEEYLELYCHGQRGQWEEED
ncbi:MAG: hypothetical protein Q9227_006800 [Pyrenula ochraceoflavens]